jgi:serine/threonine-protein kinase RsbW
LRGDPNTAPFDLDRRTFRIRLRIHVPARRESIPAALEPMMGFARECGCDEEAESDLEIALREALDNAIVHGSGSNGDKRVRIRCYGVPDAALVIAVRDEGDGFDPGDVPDPRAEDRRFLHHGRGLFLMRELLDHLVYRKGGREVVLYKRYVEPGEGHAAGT